LFSPPNYVVRKFPLSYLIEHDFDLSHMPKTEDERFHIKQGDNQLFRQIRLITKDTRTFNRHICFVDCSTGKSKPEIMERIVRQGFQLPEGNVVMSERSASMNRTGILSFVSADIAEELDKRIRMDMPMTKTVLSKYYAYRGLMLSACHLFEGWRPKIIIVPDLERVIPNQHIKFAEDRTTQFIDKEGREREWTQKEIAEGYRDITINAFDGCGIHHPEIGRQIRAMLKAEADGNDRKAGRRVSEDKHQEPVTTFILRAPYLKGLSLEMDYETFFKERGVDHVVDVWGVSHDFSEPMMIMTESMYKGKKYFKRDGTYHDWELYWKAFEQYEHCLGIAKWNFTLEEEPLWTRGNYQILQDLDLPYDEFRSLADFTVEWAEQIINGDPLHTYCFLGLMADGSSPQNNYTKAILKNPEMLKENGIRNYLIGLLEKYKDDMKCGKIYLPGTFKFLAPDLIMLMEHIGGLEPVGVLEEDEFFGFDRRGPYLGERLLERNPHICKSEHTILTGVTSPLLEKYCGHLVNVTMVNCKSITPQRLNGADFDGDLCLTLNCPTMMKGVHRDAAIVIDIEDKITVEPEEDTFENRLKITMRTLSSKIGEISNYATSYHNRTPRTEEQRKIYESYIDLLSIANGKEIDKAKTGVNYSVPRHIAKYGKTLPYFMQYASPYYKTLKKFNNAQSNMNRLCKDLERWDKSFRYKRTYKDFDYTIMIDESVPVEEEHATAIEELFLEFCKETAELAKLQAALRAYHKHKDEFPDYFTAAMANEATVDWQYYYNLYRRKCNVVCRSHQELANIAVRLCYEKYPKKNQKFMWIVAGDGILQNLKQVPLYLPRRADDGPDIYRGEHYEMVLCYASAGEERKQETEDWSTEA
jgi:hypothetical protein